MASLANRRFARRKDLGLSRSEYTILRRLRTPQQVQLFVSAIPANHEIGGETSLSVRDVLRQRRAHCIEGALVAACAFWIHGEPPLIAHLDCEPSDYPHVITLFRRGGFWGAISKHNGPQLRYRDPLYRSLRELTMSYFHEYFDKRGRKTLRSYSLPLDLRRVDPSLWVTNERGCWELHDRLDALRHFPLLAARQSRVISRRDPFERQVARIEQHPRPPTPKRRKGNRP
ncbi:MAG TPA: hypothetical protein VF420_05830 [Casimicrobiaceae bacterium]